MTGANGFVGRRLCGFLADQGHQVLRAVRCFDDLPNSVELNELSAGNALRTAMTGVDCVIHLAAMVHVMEKVSPQRMAEYDLTNVRFTERLALAARQANVSRFVFVSSIGVIGADSRDQPYTEATPPHPKNLYAKSKWEAEELLHGFGSKGGLEIVIGRPVLVYGEGVKANFLSLLSAIDRGIPLPFGLLSNRRSFVYVGNLVSALAACAMHPKAAGQTYNLCDSASISVSDLVHSIAQLMGRKARMLPCPRRLMKWLGILTGQRQRVSSIINSLEVDSSKIRRELGWEPPHTAAEGLARTVAWYQMTFNHRRS